MLKLFESIPYNTLYFEYNLSLIFKFVVTKILQAQFFLESDVFFLRHSSLKGILFF